MPGSRQSLAPVPDDGFASRLRAQRLADDLTQIELAERFQVRQQTIGAWERGDRPQPRFFSALATYLGLPDELALQRLLTYDAALREQAVETDRVPTDVEIMKRLAKRFLDGPSTSKELEVLLGFTEYFRQRQEVS